MMRAYYKDRLAADIFQMAASQRRDKEESTDAQKRPELVKELAFYCKDADESFIQPNSDNYIYACDLLNKLKREEALESIFSRLPPITSNGKLRLLLGKFYGKVFHQKKQNDGIKGSNEQEIAKALEAKKVGKRVILIIGRGNVQGTHGAVNDLGAHYVYLTPNLFNFTRSKDSESCICSTLNSVATEDSYKNLFSQIVIDGGTRQHLIANLPGPSKGTSQKELYRVLLAQLRGMSNEDELNLLMPVDRPDPSVRPPGLPCPTKELTETLDEYDHASASCERSYLWRHPFAARNRWARDAMCGSNGGASMFSRGCHLVTYREGPPANRNACDATRGSSGASMFGQKSPRPKQQQTGPGPSSSHLFSEL